MRGFDNSNTTYGTNVKLGSGGTGRNEVVDGSSMYKKDNVFSIPDHSHSILDNQLHEGTYTNDYNSFSYVPGEMWFHGFGLDSRQYNFKSGESSPEKHRYLTNATVNLSNNKVESGLFRIEPYYFKMIYIMKIN